MFFERETSTATEFAFKHSLMRDAVYDSMLRRDRHRYHLAMAEGIAAARPRLADRRPDLVAEHFEAADRGADASHWWQRAAELANQTASASEAVRFYRKALESAGDDDPMRRVELEVARAGALSNLYGFGDVGGYRFRTPVATGGFLVTRDMIVGYGFGMALESRTGIVRFELALGEGDTFSDAKVHVGLEQEF